MTLGRFAYAVGAPRKWILNSHALLGLDRDYTVERAKLLSVVRLLETDWHTTLTQAFRLAKALTASTDWTIESPSGDSQMTLNRDRILSSFAVRLSFALGGFAEKRRGRPRATRHYDLRSAHDYGVDLSLIESSLARTPAERLAQLDEDVGFVSKLVVVEQ